MCELDCIGISCPMPIVCINKEMKVMNQGDTLVVKADDPAFKMDVEAWVNKTGNTLLSMKQEENIITAKIEKVL